MTLNELAIGNTGTITKVNGEGALRRRLLEMGLTPRTAVCVSKTAPSGDPLEITIRGYQLTLRMEEAANIEVTPKEGAQ